MRKYTAQITNDYETIDYEIEGWGKTPQEFHKIVLLEHINYPKEEILYISNADGKKVFRLNKGFNGS